MVDANEKDEAPKSDSSPEEDEAVLTDTVEEDDDVDDEDEYEEEEEEEEDEYDEEEDPEEEEKEASDGGNAVAVVNSEGLETSKENAVKEDGKKGQQPKSDKKSGEDSKSKEKRNSTQKRKKSEKNDSGTLAVNGDKAESSKKKGSKRVASMGMVFMCSTKTKTDCFHYKILGLPESKKDQVLKIYRGMRLFLFDVDLRLMYGIFKAAGPGGYNIEPKAFKSEFPSQVRFTVLDDCLPLAEVSFKPVLKENYYSRTKFEGLLKAEQVKKLCKLFVRSGGRSKSAAKRRRARSIEARRDESHRSRADDRRTSRAQERRKRRARDEERRSRSPLPRVRERERVRDEERRPRSRSSLAREKRRYIDYDHPPVLYDREPPVPRYHLPPQPAVMGSPVRLYTYERQPLNIPPYVRDVRGHVPEPQPYRVVERERERDPYLAYGREPPLYRDRVYTTAPDYHLVSREYHHPAAVQPSEYRRVRDYRDVEIASDYRSSAVALPPPEYRSRTHYKY